MTILTTDNRELTLLQLGKLVKYTDEHGDEDWRTEPCNLMLCKDKDGSELELEVTAIKRWYKPYTFMTDTTTEEESEQEEARRISPLAITWTLDSLLTYCSTKTGVTPEELCTRTKNRTVTAVRGLYCYLACILTSDNLVSIGNKVGLAHNMVIY
jgi:chromosomal replication initiation ATPase DnaA